MLRGVRREVSALRRLACRGNRVRREVRNDWSHSYRDGDWRKCGWGARTYVELAGGYAEVVGGCRAREA
jgi:hypothetical protein